MSNDWQTGMFGCCDDIGICLCGTFFPLYLSCQIASDMNECCLCGGSVAMRTMYRTRYGIPGSICSDFLWLCLRSNAHHGGRKCWNKKLHSIKCCITSKFGDQSANMVSKGFRAFLISKLFGKKCIAVLSSKDKLTCTAFPQVQPRISAHVRFFTGHKILPAENPFLNYDTI
ncbi:Placenta-specific gene 8 protein [Manis javanica]|nr:Placenta-specific gene 8 protein [Manis javanica]